MEKEANRSYVDERVWKPTIDTNGNGFSIIRFLPLSKSDMELVENPDDKNPYVRYYTHAFKNQLSGKWFIENCPTSVGDDCPVNKAVAHAA